MKKITLFITVFALMGLNSAIFAQWQTNGNDLYYNSGFVGIGTDSPFKPFDLDGDLHDTPMIIRSSDDYCYIGFMDPNTDHHQKVRVGAIGNELSLRAGDNEAIRIRQNGDVVVKNTSALILKSPDGTEWKISVDNSGNLSTNVSTKIEETNSQNNVNVFPNPSNDNITIDLGDIVNSNVTVELYDISGKMVIMKKYEQADNIVLDLSGYKAGNYIAKIRTENGEVVKSKMIIKE